MIYQIKAIRLGGLFGCNHTIIASPALFGIVKKSYLMSP